MGALNSTLSSDQLVSAGAAAAIVAVSAVVYATKPKASSTPSTETTAEETESAATAKKQGRRGKRAPKGRDGTPPALAAQAALFDSEAKSSGVEDGSGSLTKSKNKKRSKKTGDPSPLAAPAKKTVKEQSKAKPKPKATPVSLTVQQDAENEEEEEAEETPLSSSTPVGGKAAKGTFNKFASLTDSQVSTTPSMDASWLQVSQNTRRKAGVAKNQESSSDAGMTNTSADETPQITSLAALESKLGREKVKTAVDDMLPPDPTMARVMRVTNPNDTDDMLHSTDADEEEGWGIVRRRGTPKLTDSSHSASVSVPPSEPTKDQRRRDAKKELSKEVKAEVEADRLARLAKHRKEQEKARIEELAKKVGKGGKVSGGMRAIVNNDGKLVWE